MTNITNQPITSVYHDLIGTHNCVSPWGVFQSLRVICSAESIRCRNRSLSWMIGQHKHNLLRAIEAGIFNESTKDRMNELQEQKEELKTALAAAKLKEDMGLKKEHILFFLHQFTNKKGHPFGCPFFVSLYKASTSAGKGGFLTFRSVPLPYGTFWWH